MEDNQKSDRPQMPESTPNSPETDFIDHYGHHDHGGEEIIDLTEIVTKEDIESSHTSTHLPTPAQDEDDIIELTDIVPPQKDTTMGAGIAVGDEDDIIELTDIVQPDTSPAQDVPPPADLTTADEDDIIELTDIVQPQTATAQGTTSLADLTTADEDDIIELTDVVQPKTVDEVAVPPAESNALDEQQFIDLVDMDLPQVPTDDTPPADQAMPDFDDQEYQEVVGQLPDQDDYFEKQNQSLEDTLSELESMMDDTFSGEEGIIQLDDVLNGQDASDVISDMSDDMALEDSAEDDFDDFPIGIALDEPSDDVVSDQQPPSLTNEQIDAAVERLIQKKYGQTIEQLIATSVEKIVTKQIESLRQSLLEDDDPIE